MEVPLDLTVNLSLFTCNVLYIFNFNSLTNMSVFFINIIFNIYYLNMKSNFLYIDFKIK